MSSSSQSCSSSDECIDVDVVATACSNWISKLPTFGHLLLQLPEEYFLKHDFYLCGLRKSLGKSCSSIIRWCISDSSASPLAGLQADTQTLLAQAHRRFTETFEGEQLILHKAAQGLYGSCDHCGCLWRLPRGSDGSAWSGGEGGLALHAVCVRCWQAGLVGSAEQRASPAMGDDSGRWFSPSLPASILLSLTAAEHAHTADDNEEEEEEEEDREGEEEGTALGKGQTAPSTATSLQQLQRAIRSSMREASGQDIHAPTPQALVHVNHSPQGHAQGQGRGGPQEPSTHQLQVQLTLYGFRLHPTALPAVLRPAAVCTSGAAPHREGRQGKEGGLRARGESSSSSSGEDTEEGSIRGVRRPVTLPPIARRRKH